MTPFQLAAITGALTTTAALLLAVALVWYSVETWLKARRWERFARACGDEESALVVVKAAEDTADAAADLFTQYDFRAAQRRGLLKPEDCR